MMVGATSAISYPDCKDKQSFETGMEFQDFVVDALAKYGIILQNYMSKKYQYTIGENVQGFEIKYDSRCTDTGRLSIEIAEKSRADIPSYTKSGIYRDDNTWLYIQGNYRILFVFPKNYLRRLHGCGKYQEASMPTIKKFYLPFDDAFKYAAKVIDLRA